MPKHGSVILYVHGNQKARSDGQPRTATSTLTQLLNYEGVGQMLMMRMEMGDLFYWCRKDQ